MNDTIRPLPSLKTSETTRFKVACEHCGDVALVKRTMLSIYTGKTVRVFECSAGHRTWRDE
jgi:hypothetical protein